MKVGGFFCLQRLLAMIRRYALLLGLCALPLSTLAQVVGTVLGDEDQLLEAAAIQLFDRATGQERYAAVTSRDGRFEIGNVRPGRYLLVATYLGYAPHRRPLTVASEPVMLRIVLSAMALETPAVVVSTDRARRQLSPITHSNVTARDLALLPGMKDLPANLRRSTSVTYYSENGNDLGYTHLRLRGFGQRRVAVAINGVPQNDPEGHNVYWINFYDLQGTVKDIQLQRGAGSSFYGSAGIGGAINVIASPYEAERYGRIEIGYGSFNTQRYTIEGNTGLLGGKYVAYGRRSHLLTDGYRDWSWSKFWRYFVGITRYGERHTVTLQAYGGPQTDGLAYVGIPKSANKSTVTDVYGTKIDRRYNFSESTRDREWFHQPHSELLHEWVAKPSLLFKQTLFWIRGIGHFDFDGSFRSADFLRLPDQWRGLTKNERALPLFLSAPSTQVLFRAALDQYQVGWLPRAIWVHRGGETTVGLEARLHQSLRWGRVQEATGLPAEVVGPRSDYRVYSVRGEKVVASAFGSHLARVHERVAMQADVQLTWRQYRTYDEAFFGNAFRVPYLFVNPRLGVTINPERPVSAYASVALANREPRHKSLYEGEEAGAGATPQFKQTTVGTYDYGAPLVGPERLVDFELGAGVSKTSWRMEVNVYFMQFADEIVPSGGLDQFGVPRTGNADQTRHLGLELEAAARLAPGLDVYGNATISRSRFVRFIEYVSPEGVDRANSPIAGFPSPVANVGVTYEWRGLRARTDLLYTGAQYVDNGGGRDGSGANNPDYEVDAHALVNGSLRYTFAQPSPFSGLEVYLDVNNVLNDRVLLYGNAGFGAPQFFPAATRHVFFGARYTLR